jgi:hypothetical protein
MKTLTKIFILIMFANLGTWIIPQKANAQEVAVSFQVFYDDLSPYGTWINNPTYGYVWIPNEAPGFSPYATNGYWVYTDYGWTWVSNYPWGWAPFHYGRWYYDSFYGPIWVPDNEWGPGWVDWRSSDGYYGWAPMGPGSYYASDDEWTFVEVNYFGTTTINNYYINSTKNKTIINNSVVVNNPRTNNSTHINYNGGPDKAEVEKHTGKSITPVVVKESNAHGQSLNNGQLEIYKPNVQKKDAAETKAAPAKVADLKTVKTIEQKKAEKTNQPAQQKAGSQSKTDQQPKAQPKTDQQPKAQPKTDQQPKAQPKTDQQPKAQPKTDQQPKAQPKTNPQPQPKTNPQPQPKTNPQPQPKTNPQPQPKTNPQPQPSHKPKPH